MIKYNKLEKIIEKNLLSEVKWFLAFANPMYHGLRGREPNIPFSYRGIRMRYIYPTGRKHSLDFNFVNFTSLYKYTSWVLAVNLSKSKKNMHSHWVSNPRPWENKPVAAPNGIWDQLTKVLGLFARLNSVYSFFQQGSFMILSSTFYYLGNFYPSFCNYDVDFHSLMISFKILTWTAC